MVLSRSGRWSRFFFRARAVATARRISGSSNSRFFASSLTSSPARRRAKAFRAFTWKAGLSAAMALARAKVAAWPSAFRKAAIRFSCPARGACNNSVLRLMASVSSESGANAARPPRLRIVAGRFPSTVPPLHLPRDRWRPRPGRRRFARILFCPAKPSKASMRGLTASLASGPIRRSTLAACSRRAIFSAFKAVARAGTASAPVLTRAPLA